MEWWIEGSEANVLLHLFSIFTLHLLIVGGVLCHRMRVEVRDIFQGTVLSFPPEGAQELNLGQQTPLPTKPSLCHYYIYFKQVVNQTYKTVNKKVGSSWIFTIKFFKSYKCLIFFRLRFLQTFWNMPAHRPLVMENQHRKYFRMKTWDIDIFVVFDFLTSYKRSLAE